MKNKEYGVRERVYDECLRTGREYTSAELMELVNRQLEMKGMNPILSRNTFSLDMREMDEELYSVYGFYGILTEKRGRQVYYSYKPGIKGLYNRDLTVADREKLQQVSQLLLGFRGMPHFDWVEEVMARSDQHAMANRHEVASFESGTRQDEQFFMDLFTAIRLRQVVDVVYQRFGAEPKERTLHPYYLKQYRQRWYLFAVIEGKETVCCWALDRLRSLKRNTTVAFRPTEVDFSHYFDDFIGVTRPDNAAVEHIVLRADDWVVNYLRTSPLHVSQQIGEHTEDGTPVTLDVMVNHELEQELLFLGEHVAVVAPEHFRQQMIDRVRQQLNRLKTTHGVRPHV